jgi:predicted ATPase/DNA-binding SARP family transcriptional activator
LGGFQAILADQPITAFESNKVRGLLAYLAVEATGVAHSRSSLAELLWPGYGEEQARASLRQSLHHLRKSLGDDRQQSVPDALEQPEFLLVTRQTIQFNPDADYAVDVAQFADLLTQCSQHAHPQLAVCPTCLPRLRQALALYRGDFLAGFAVDDSTEFEEWRRYKQEELHIQALDLLATLTDAAEASGDYTAARHYARRQIELEPWRDIAHRRLIQILARSGDRRAAIAQYHAYRQTVKREVGGEPEAETVALYEQIRQASPAEAEQKAVQEVLVAHNALPVPSSRFVGRHEALAAIQGLFPHTRLVTLTGPSGSGKTRLAIAAAAALTSRFADGVCVVELAPVTDPKRLPQAVAQALSQAPSNQDGQDGVANYLHFKQLLLVLDSCEHLLEAVTHWGKRWLSTCPDLCILATSHGPLHIEGEHVWPVPALSYPLTSSGLLPEQLMSFEAVQLFVARAQAVKVGFALNATNGSAIAQICQQLEGIPLALELAAARVKVLTPAEIAERLKQRIDVAIATNPGATPRHQTLRAALNWSFDLLNPAEQALLRRLAVFTGGFDLHALEAVVKLPNESIDVLEVLSSLIDRSLVMAEIQGDQTRYRMLGVIREYAQDQLVESGEAQEVCQRHLDYFLQLVERALSDPQVDDEALWLRPEADNFGSALNWALAEDNLPSVVCMSGALTWYWWMRGYLSSLRDPLLQAVEGLERSSYRLAEGALPRSLPAARAVLPFAVGSLLAMWGELARAKLALTQALALAEEEHDWPTAGLALRRLVGVAIEQKDYHAANEYIARGLGRWQALGGTWHIAWLYAHQGDIAYQWGDQTRAWLAYEASAKLPVNPSTRAYPFRRMAYLQLARGDTTQALTLCHTSLELNLASGDRVGIAACLVSVACIKLTHAQSLPQAARYLVMRQAAQLIGAVASLLRTVGGRLLPADESVYQQTATRLREQLEELSPESYAAAHTEGESMVVEQAIAFALQEDGVALHEEVRHLDEVTSRQDGSMSDADPSAIDSAAPPLLAPSPLSKSMTPFVGREDELAEISRRLQAPDVRLITLVGPGGMGKTRLAIEVGRALHTEFADGVYFVALASLSAPAALAPTIATAIGLNLQGGEPRRMLLQFLHPKQMLLILDNFEHLLAGVDLVLEMLQAAPELRIITTSRQRLNVSSEHLYIVQPMAFTERATLAEAGRAEAVRLFVQSARRVRANFVLDESNLAAVLRICHLVQGMPLGLELAAAWTDTLRTKEIAQEIDKSADFLAVDWSDAPERQRSMRAVFEWSWKLLNDVERQVLCQLALFRGGFARDAAETVTGATLPLLRRLTEKSLLQWQATADGGGRYAMHELLRQFAAEELKASGEYASVEERHGRYYLAYLAARGLRLGRREPKEASAEIRAELDNVRLAWQWAATQGHVVELEQAIYGWWQFCLLQGLEAEGRQSFAAAIAGVRQQLASTGQDAAATPLGQGLLAKLLAIHADFLFAQGRDEEMAAQAREAIELGAASGAVEGETFGSFVLGRVFQEFGLRHEAGVQWRQTLQLFHRYLPDHPESEILNDSYWMAHNWLRGNAIGFGDYPGARAHLLHALEHAQKLGKRRAEVHTLYGLAHTDYLLFDFVSAEPSYRAVLDLTRALGFRRLEMSALEGLGGFTRLQGDYTTARKFLEEALALAVELALHYDESMILAALARLHCQVGDQAAAANRLEQLTRLLASVKLARECQLYGYLTAACKALATGALQEAHLYAEQANQLNEKEGEILFRVVDAALIVGHSRAAVRQWQAAQASFQQALDAFQQLDKPALAAEAQAGLAQIALAQDDLVGALALVEAILPILTEEPRLGYNNPFFIYLTCYRVLAANADPRAAVLLQQGYDLLQLDAASLGDAERHGFLSAVPIHRDLVKAYMEWRAPIGKVTSDEMTTALVTPSPTYDLEKLPTMRHFHGRSGELATLTGWVNDSRCRLVVVLGIGGVGKSALVAQMVRAVASQFDWVIWSSLLNAPPLGELLRHWLRVLAQPEGIRSPEGDDEQLRLLVQCLCRQRCLLVLDNAESILCSTSEHGAGSAQPAGALRAGYEGYAQLLQSLSQDNHRSCLLITSRELPHALSNQIHQTPTVQVLSLDGLEAEAGQALLQAYGLERVMNYRPSVERIDEA